MSGLCSHLVDIMKTHNAIALSRYSHCGRGRRRTEWLKFPVQAKTMLRRWMLPAQLILLFLTLGSTVGWAETVEEHEVKATYIYGFAQFTTWPKSPEKGVNFCIHGNHPVGDGLRKLHGKNLRNAPVNIQQVSSAEEAKSCHVLFLHPENRGELVQWISTLESLPILVVSDSLEAFQEKVTIAFTVESNHVTFKINLTQARVSGLFFSSQMLKLAQEIR